MSALIPIDDEASVSVARQTARDLAARAQVDPMLAERASIVVSELAHNQLRHGRMGEILLRVVQRGAVSGLTVTATDSGRGFTDAVRAFSGESNSDSVGLGIGLAGVRRLAAEVSVDSRTGEGLCIQATLLPAGAPSRPQYAILGRPHPDEYRSGDDAVIVELDDAVVAAVADGLGHGSSARQASEAAVQAVKQHADVAPEALMELCAESIRRTRGTAMAIARLDLIRDEVIVAIAGNVRVGLYGPEGGQRFPYTPKVLGRPGGRTVRSITAPRDGRTLVMFSDGLPDRTNPAEDRGAVVGWPVPLASRLLLQHARATDDALVLVLR